MKKAIAIIALIALTVGFSTITLANDEGKPNNITELKFIGNMENQPVFQLNLTNAEEDEITVTFRDEVGNVLYTDKFKGANISKKFLLKSEDFGNAALHVVVKSKKNNTSEVYTINRSHTYVEETVVNKIK
ncbi:hypothetical protein FAM09_04100 [Niastella caeni]|uniref:DUF3244 domain-containing protein n=1 Tax=Niastella caeni TaxID=2569763 RepID=A0A4S8I226_9BACT|nr:hypothetical protein [Niastella caeni]THU41299.1 hypothetical protein FAM09_04100 [Niastella caeni]